MTCEPCLPDVDLDRLIMSVEGTSCWMLVWNQHCKWSSELIKSILLTQPMLTIYAFDARWKKCIWWSWAEACHRWQIWWLGKRHLWKTFLYGLIGSYFLQVNSLVRFGLHRSLELWGATLFHSLRLKKPVFMEYNYDPSVQYIQQQKPAGSKISFWKFLKPLETNSESVTLITIQLPTTTTMGNRFAAATTSLSHHYYLFG